MTVRSDDLIHGRPARRDRDPPPDIAPKIPRRPAELWWPARETPILEIARSKDFSLEKLKRGAQAFGRNPLVVRFLTFAFADLRSRPGEWRMLNPLH